MKAYFCRNRLLCLMQWICFVPTIYSVTLRGVALVSEPFVTRKGVVFEGYCIDILNEIGTIADFNYYLYTTSDDSYGVINANKTNITGILGQVWSNEADFAISDITVTEERKKFVDFTEPLMNYSVNALIHKLNIANMRTFNDIADQTRVSYGSVIGSQTWKLFESSNDMVLRRMFALMNSKGVSVNSSEDGFDKVKSSKYAFFGDSTINEYIAANDCDLTFISDDREYFRNQIAIAFPKGSQYLSVFNNAIKQLNEKKRFQQLRDIYWNKNCLTASSHKLLFSSFILFSVLIVQNFLVRFISFSLTINP